ELGVFAFLALGGSVAGFLFTHPKSSALPLVVPVFLAYTYRAVGPLTEGGCKRLLRFLEPSLYMYVALHLLASLNVIPSGVNRSVGPSSLFSNGSFTHEKAALLFMAL